MRVEEKASYRVIHEATGLYKRHYSYSKFFQNRLYTGILEFGGEVYGKSGDEFVPPLIPVEWYETEKERRERKAKRRQKGGKSQGEPDPRHVSNGRLLSGLLYCKECGSKLWSNAIPEGVISTTGRRRDRWPFYLCSKAKHGECSAGKIHADTLERRVLQRLKADVLSLPNLRAHADKLLVDLSTHRQDSHKRLNALEEQIAGARQRAENLAVALAQRPTSTTLLRHLDETESLQKRLEREIAMRQTEHTYWDNFALGDKELARLISQMHANLESGDPNQARAALSVLISRIEVAPGKPPTARVQYAFPKWMPPDSEGHSREKQGFTSNPLGGIAVPSS
jgi:hypothetical protein